MNEQQPGFRDPTVVTKWTTYILYASMLVSLLSAWEYVRELPGYADDSPSAFSAPEIALNFVGIAITLAAAILVLTWIHRANHNARQLGAAGMRYTPGGAVGWYFVPVAWFWKPYQAMKEIWRASANPSDWAGRPVSPVLLWWWILWIVPFWGGSLVDWWAGLSLDERSAEVVQAATGIALELTDIPLALVLIAIIRRVHDNQMEHHNRQITDGT